MDYIDVLRYAIALYLGFVGHLDFDQAKYAYAVAHIPPGSTATYVQVRINGTLSGECQMIDGSETCTLALVGIYAKPLPSLDVQRYLDIDIESDGAWNAEIWLKKYPADYGDVVRPPIVRQENRVYIPMIGR